MGAVTRSGAAQEVGELVARRDRERSRSIFPTDRAWGTMDHEMEQKGCLCRIKNCAIELFSAMEEDLEVDDEDSWDLVGRELRLKATFLYIDLSRVIAFCEGEEHKKALTVLANKFFYSMDELGDAVESRSLPLTQVRYSNTADALREVVAVLAPSLLQVGPPHDPEE